MRLQKDPRRKAFVESMPLDTPVSEVVEKARESGFRVTPKYIYAIRTKQKKESMAQSLPHVQLPIPNGNGHNDHDREHDCRLLRRIIVNRLGLDRAEAEFESLKEKVSSM